MSEDYLICKKNLEVKAYDETKSVTGTTICSEDIWADVKALKIIHFPWNTTELVSENSLTEAAAHEKYAVGSYKAAKYISENCVPEMYAKLLYTQDRLCIYLNAYEKYPRAGNPLPDLPPPPPHLPRPHLL